MKIENPNFLDFQKKALIEEYEKRVICYNCNSRILPSEDHKTTGLALVPLVNPAFLFHELVMVERDPLPGPYKVDPFTPLKILHRGSRRII